MFWKILAKPHEQSGLYKYKISKHALEFKKKNKVVCQEGIQLNFYQKPFQKGYGNID